MNLHYITAHRKGIDTKNMAVTAWASTQDLDSEDEAILASAWQHSDSTAAFERNPIGLIGHDYRSLPVFKVERLDKTPRGLKFTAKFYDTPSSKECFDFIAASGLASFSVGFSAVAFEDMDPREVKRTYGIDCSAAKSGRVRVYTHVRLHEISLVAIGANSAATAVGAAFEGGLVRTPELSYAIKSMKPRAGRDMTAGELMAYFKGEGFKKIIKDTVREEIQLAFDKAKGKVY